jgi:hypothetical protein
VLLGQLGPALSGPGPGAGPGRAGLGRVPITGPLDLWDLLFSRSFAVLVEDLLRESLIKVRAGVVQKVESALAIVRAAAHGPLTAHELNWAADQIGKCVHHPPTSRAVADD